MPLLQPLVVQATRGSSRPEFDQYPVLIAANGRKAARDQEIGGPLWFERATQVIAKIYDLADAERRNIGKHRFEGGIVAVDVCNRGEFHFSVLFRR